MGLLDKLRGVKRPPDGSAVLPRDELTRRLVALNDEQVPFSVSIGEGGGDGDIVVEWKIVDASWYEIFAEAHIEKAHRLLLTFADADHEVRALEESYEVSWRAGVPTLSLSAEKFRGRTFGSKQYGTAYAYRGVNPLDVGQAYEYRFDVAEMKAPVVDTVTGGGWTFVPVTTKRGLRAS